MATPVADESGLRRPRHTDRRERPCRPVTGSSGDHPFATFAVLACLFGWGIYIAAAFGLGTNPSNMPLGPLLAALVVASCRAARTCAPGAAGCGRGARRPKWYAVAVLLPLVDPRREPWSTTSSGAPLPTLAQLGALAGRPGHVRR